MSSENPCKTTQMGLNRTTQKWWLHSQHRLWPNQQVNQYPHDVAMLLLKKTGLSHLSLIVGQILMFDGTSTIGISFSKRKPISGYTVMVHQPENQGSLLSCSNRHSSDVSDVAVRSLLFIQMMIPDYIHQLCPIQTPLQNHFLAIKSWLNHDSDVSCAKRCFYSC